MANTTDLSNVLAWRKLELTHIKSQFNNIENLDVDSKIHCYKTSMLLMYSHLEGGIKDCIKSFLISINDDKQELNKLNYGITLLSNKHKLQGVSIHNYSLLAEVVKLKDSNDIFNVSEKSIDEMLKKIGNIDEEILGYISTLLNINLDLNGSLKNTLVLRRHKIAHGTKVDKDDTTINMKFLEECHKRVRDVLDKFSVELSAQISSKSYIRT